MVRFFTALLLMAVIAASSALPYPKKDDANSDENPCSSPANIGHVEGTTTGTSYRTT